MNVEGLKPRKEGWVEIGSATIRSGHSGSWVAVFRSQGSGLNSHPVSYLLRGPRQRLSLCMPQIRLFYYHSPEPP